LQNALSKLICIQLCPFAKINFVGFNHGLPILVGIKGADEAGTKKDFVAFVGGFLVNGLGKGIVVTRYEYQDFGVPGLQFFLAQAEEGTVLGDGMNQGPGQGKERNVVPFQFQGKNLILSSPSSRSYIIRVSLTLSSINWFLRRLTMRNIRALRLR
jgi:hypothetical protein